MGKEEIQDGKPSFVIADVLPGRLNALVKNIMKQMGIDDPNEAVRRVNAKEWVVKKFEKDFPLWRTIKLGTGIKDGNGFQEAIENDGMKVNDWARDMLCQSAFTVTTMETEVDLVKVTVEELGFHEATRYDKICERARQLGLQLCPNEVGPQLRLQYKEQPNGEWIRVAMEAIRDSGGRLRLFGVGHDDGVLWLDGDFASPGSLFDPGDAFVFVVPASNLQVWVK